MENRGVGNEVRYYVFDYPAEQELAVRAWVRDAVRKMKTAARGPDRCLRPLRDDNFLPDGEGLHGKML